MNYLGGFLLLGFLYSSFWAGCLYHIGTHDITSHKYYDRLSDQSILKDRSLSQARINEWLDSARLGDVSVLEDRMDLARTAEVEVLLHSAVIAHPKPQSVAVVTSSPNDANRWVREAFKHHGIENIWIVSHPGTEQSILTSTSDDTWSSRDRNSTLGIRYASVETLDSQIERPRWNVLIMDLPDSSPEALTETTLQCLPFLAVSPDPEVIQEEDVQDTSLFLLNLRSDSQGHGRFYLIKALEAHQTTLEQITDFDMRPAHTRATWTVLVGFSSRSMKACWHQSVAEWDLKAMQSFVDGAALESLAVFDKLQHLIQEYPSRRSEELYCQQHSCSHRSGFDAEAPNIPLSDLHIQQSQMGEHSGRGVFSKVDIDKNSYIGLEHIVSVKVSWTSAKLIERLYEESEKNKNLGDAWEDIIGYIDGYGFVNEESGGRSTVVDSSFLTFANHGCNGTYNIGTDSSNHEGNLVVPPPPSYLVASTNYTGNGFDMMDDDKYLLKFVPAEYRPNNGQMYFPIRNPSFAIMASARIPKDGEVLDNYMSFSGERAFWNYMESLKQECGGMLGSIERYQQGSTNERTSGMGSFDLVISDPTVQEVVSHGSADEEL